MSKIYKIIAIFILSTLAYSANAHVQHYDKLNRIEFDIYRNNKHIGSHIFSFEISGNEFVVSSEIFIPTHYGFIIIRTEIMTVRNRKETLTGFSNLFC